VSGEYAAEVEAVQEMCAGLRMMDVVVGDKHQSLGDITGLKLEDMIKGYRKHPAVVRSKTDVQDDPHPPRIQIPPGISPTRIPGTATPSPGGQVWTVQGPSFYVDYQEWLEVTIDAPVSLFLENLKTFLRSHPGAHKFTAEEMEQVRLDTREHLLEAVGKGPVRGVDVGANRESVIKAAQLLTAV
jgi:hypothetical protein